MSGNLTPYTTIEANALLNDLEQSTLITCSPNRMTLSCGKFVYISHPSIKAPYGIIFIHADIFEYGCLWKIKRIEFLVSDPSVRSVV